MPVTRRPTAVQLARDVLHYDRCRSGLGCVECQRASGRRRSGYVHTQEAVTLARALLRATKEKR